MDRHFVVKHTCGNLDYEKWFLDPLMEVAKKLPGSKVYVFQTSDAKQPETPRPGVVYVDIPKGTAKKDEEAKIHNAVIRYFKLENATSGQLYVFDERLEVNGDNLCAFVPKLERFMSVFGYRVWLNTFGDECNFVFDRYEHRWEIDIDVDKYKAVWAEPVRFYTNCNFDFVVYDLDQTEASELLLDEQFKIGMFFILEFIGRKIKANVPGFFMNAYPSIDGEKGLFVKHDKADFKVPEEKVFAAEMEKFKSMGVRQEAVKDPGCVVKYLSSRLDLALKKKETANG